MQLARLRRLDLFALSGFMTGLLLVAGVVVTTPLSGDVFWHLAAGNWMLAHHQVMGADPFSYTLAGKHWTATEWGYEVILAESVKVFGGLAYFLLPVAATAGCLGFTWAYLRRLGATSTRIAWLLMLVAAAVAPFIVQDRGLSLSLVYFPATLYLVTAARRNPWLLVLVPLLFCLWINTHGSVSLGFAVVGLELVLALFGARLWSFGVIDQVSRPGALFAAMAAGMGACLVTPYGPHLLRYDIWVETQSKIQSTIVEWQSPDFHQVFELVFFLLPLVFMVVAVFNRKVTGREFLLTGMLAVATLHSGRFFPYLLIAGAAVMATQPVSARHALRHSFYRVLAFILPFVILLSVVHPSADDYGKPAPSVPVAQFNYLANQPGRVMTEYAWSGYSIARGHKSFVDGRTDFFVGPIFNDYIALRDLSVDPDTLLSRYAVRYVVWQDNQPLGTYLTHDPAWHVVFTSAGVSVFENPAAPA